jgi:rare lipoprotein A
MRMSETLGLSLALLVASSVAMAKQNPPSHNHAGVSSKAKSASQPRARIAKKTATAHQNSASRENLVHEIYQPRGTERRATSLAAEDQYIGPMHLAGQSQVGRAAWYGSRHVGHLTASGEPLDTVHATAAHRSLPLDSMVRVTNLGNGRSVIVRINDRGPVSRSLLIDMSPRAAAAIDMIDSGIAQVMIEPVVSAGGVGGSSAR